MPLAEDLYPTLDRRRRRPVVASPLNAGQVPAAPGLTQNPLSPSAAPLLTSILGVEEEAEPRYPQPGQPRRDLDARQSRPQPGPSDRAIERFLIDTDQPAGQDDPSPLNLEDVNPVLLRQAVRLGRATEPLAVTSGVRSRADQRILYNRAQAGGSTAAPPGTSTHEEGIALDVQLTPEQRARLGDFGLGTPVQGDEPHVQITDPRLLRRAENVPMGGGGRPQTTRVGVPEIVPPALRKTVALQGQRLNEPLQEAGVNMSGPEYLAKLIQFESGWDPRAENPSSAFGLGQFIDSTAQDFRERLGVETQDPSKPRQMLKGASMHASGDFGYNPLYAGYNPGYSSSDPIPPVDVGGNVPVRVPRKRVERLSEGVDAPTGGGIPEQRPGPWAGSQAIVRQLLGPYARTEDWKDKEDRGYSSLHDIETKPGGFAADVSEDEAIVDRIARVLGRENAGISPESVDYGTTGLESGLTYKGYDIEFLPYTHGSGPHTHIGAEWTGGTPPSGTQFGGPTGGGFAGMMAGTGAGAPAAPTDQGLGQYQNLVNRQLGAIERSGLSPERPMPAGRRSLRPGEEEDEEEEAALAAILGDRFRPQRRIAL